MSAIPGLGAAAGLLAASGSEPITVLQTIAQQNIRGGNDSGSFAGSVTNGSTVIVPVSYWAGGTSVSSVTDNKGNTYSLAVTDTETGGDAGDAGCAIYYSEDVNGGASFQITVAGVDPGNFYGEWAAIETSPCTFDNTSESNVLVPVDDDTYGVDSGTLASSNAIVVAATALDRNTNNAGILVPSGFTELYVFGDASVAFPVEAAYKIEQHTTAQQVRWNWNGTPGGSAAAVGVAAFVAAAEPPTGFPEAWTHRAPIVIQESRISNSSTLTNFPVLLTQANMPDDFLDSDLFQDDGGDIRFTSDELGTNRIACEVVTFDGHATPASAVAEIWVKVPSVSPSSNTTFYMWRKTGAGETQPAVDTEFGRNAVWSDYLAVWHGDSTTDSTGNGNTLTANGGATSGSSTAKIGEAFSLTAVSSQYFTAGSPAAFDNLTEMTIQCWARLTSSDYSTIISKTLTTGDSPWYLYDTGDFVSGSFCVGWFAHGGGFIHGAGGSAAQNEWHMWAGGYDVNETLAFQHRDGVGNSFTRGSNPIDDAAGTLNIGYPQGGAGGAGFFDGQIDEVRLSPNFLHSDWHQADYENQANPDLFCIPGSVTEP